MNRLTSNADYTAVERRSFPRNSSIRADEVIPFAGTKAEKKCAERMRRVVVRDEQQVETIEFF